MRREDRDAKREAEHVHVCDAEAEDRKGRRLIPRVQLHEVVGEDEPEQALDSERDRVGHQHRQRLAVLFERADEDDLQHDPRTNIAGIVITRLTNGSMCAPELRSA